MSEEVFNRYSDYYLPMIADENFKKQSSFWLIKAIRDLEQRDCVDVLKDLEFLKGYFEAKTNELLWKEQNVITEFKIDLEYIRDLICKLMDIAEKHDPDYSSSDFIAECDDFLVTTETYSEKIRVMDLRISKE